MRLYTGFISCKVFQLDGSEGRQLGTNRFSGIPYLLLGLWKQWQLGNQKGMDTTIQYSAEIPMPQITQGVLDSGIVLYYIKDSSGLNGGAVKNFDLYYAYNVGTTNRMKEEAEESYLSRFWIHTNSDTIPKQKLTLYTEWQGGQDFMIRRPFMTILIWNQNRSIPS